VATYDDDVCVSFEGSTCEGIPFASAVDDVASNVGGDRLSDLQDLFV
jgi:hypothetical protein